jgi:hypothetical protein
MILLMVVAGSGVVAGEDVNDELAKEMVVYKEGSNTYHIPNCSRLNGDTAGWTKMTLTEAEAKGARIKCGKCARILGRKYSINMYKRQPVEVKYDPNTEVCCNALWMSVHARGCKNQLMQEKRKTMTLEAADKAGWRIAECCFHGYRRKYPQKELDDDTIIAGTMEKNRWKHVAGCHRYWPSGSHARRPLKDWVADGYGICGHCRKRGPSVATISDADWKKMDSSTGIQELPFTDPLASAEQFMGMRFFFPVTAWLRMYQQYRSTGDKSSLDKLLVSARHYNKLSTEFPEFAQKKADDPEGAAYMLSMAMWSRIILQNARTSPGYVSSEEIAEAETFLKTMLSVLEPNWEGRKDLDSEMGIPKQLADDFRSRQANRSINGIATVGMMTAAIKDLQAIKGTKTYQPQIDHYRNIAIKSWLSFFKDSGYICKKNGGFYYAYRPEGKGRKVIDGCKVFKRPEDNSHYRFTVTGLVFLYESELVDDDFMTSVATAIHNGMKNRQGAFTCPCVPRKKVKNFRGESEEYIVLNAFKEGTSKGRGGDTDNLMQFAQYIKTLRADRSLIHLGGKE